MNIGTNLKIIRNKKIFSQQQVADYLGVDRKTYVSWESGTVDIKSSFIPKLAGFLCVDINDLFQTRSADIVIRQHNTDNKDTSIHNCIVFLLTNKESMNQLVKKIREDYKHIKIEFI